MPIYLGLVIISFSFQTLKLAEKHLELVNSERSFYIELCRTSKETVKDFFGEVLQQLPSPNTEKTPCEYGPVFAPYLHDWTLYGINTVQKRVRIYMAFFLCNAMVPANTHAMTMHYSFDMAQQVKI